DSCPSFAHDLRARALASEYLADITKPLKSIELVQGRATVISHIGEPIAIPVIHPDIHQQLVQLFLFTLVAAPFLGSATPNASRYPFFGRAVLQRRDYESCDDAQCNKDQAGFYPEITDGCKRAENFRSCLAILRRILGLWNRSMYSNTSVLAASSVGYFVR